MTLAKLVVRIAGDTAQLTKSLDRAQGHVRRWSRRIGPSLATAGKAFAGLGIAAAGAVAALGVKSVMSFAAAGDEIHKMALRTGFSTEELSRLRFAAEQSGADLGQLEKATRRMAGVILDADKGLSTATDTLDLLGVSLSDLQAMTPEQQFAALTTALAGVEDASRRAALAEDLFGRSGAALLPLVAEGADGIAALKAEAEALGVVYSQEAAQSAADFADAQNRVMTALRGVALDIGAKLAPVLVRLMDWLTEHGPQIAAVFADVRARVEPVVRAMAAWIRDDLMPVLVEVWGILRDHVIPVVIDLGERAFAVVAEVWRRDLKPTLDELVALVRDQVLPWVRENRDTWIAAWELIAAVVVPVLESVVISIRTSIGIITGVIRLFVRVLRGDWGGAWQAVLDIVRTAVGGTVGVLRAFGLDLEAVWRGIADRVTAIAEPIISTIQRIIDLARTVTGAIGSIPGVGAAAKASPVGVGVSLARKIIPGFAGGVQNFSGGLARVHEGEVLTTLPRGTSVIPAAAAQGGGVTVNINLPHYIGTPEQLAAAINEARREWRRRGGEA